MNRQTEEETSQLSSHQMSPLIRGAKFVSTSPYGIAQVPRISCGTVTSVTSVFP